jgi:hypothetical protein
VRRYYCKDCSPSFAQVQADKEAASKASVDSWLGSLVHARSGSVKAFLHDGALIDVPKSFRLGDSCSLRDSDSESECMRKVAEGAIWAQFRRDHEAKRGLKSKYLYSLRFAAMGEAYNSLAVAQSRILRNKWFRGIAVDEYVGVSTGPFYIRSRGDCLVQRQHAEYMDASFSLIYADKCCSYVLCTTINRQAGESPDKTAWRSVVSQNVGS